MISGPLLTLSGQYTLIGTALEVTAYGVWYTSTSTGSATQEVNCTATKAGPSCRIVPNSWLFIYAWNHMGPCSAYIAEGKRQRRNKN